MTIKKKLYIESNVRKYGYFFGVYYVANPKASNPVIHRIFDVGFGYGRIVSMFAKGLYFHIAFPLFNLQNQPNFGKKRSFGFNLITKKPTLGNKL